MLLVEDKNHIGERLTCRTIVVPNQRFHDFVDIIANEHGQLFAA